MGYWTGLLAWITGSTFELNCSYHLLSSQSEKWTDHMFIVATTMVNNGLLYNDGLYYTVVYYTMSAVTIMVA